MDNHIPTTATAVQKLNRLAKTRRKSTGESLAAAQNAVAREHGYRDWKHLRVCEAATAASKSSPVVLPAVVADFLAAQQAADPADDETLRALASGMVFAMNIKDAESVQPDSSSSEIHDCEDARAYVAGDIWLAMLRHEQEEGYRSDAELDADEQLQQFFDDLGNYRFYRYSGCLKLTSVDDAFAGPLRGFFFPPTHLWIGGKFHDVADVREVRVDGKVVFSSSPASNGKPAAPAVQPASAPAASTPNIIARLDVRKLEPSLYEFHASYSGELLSTDAGFASIADALRAAAQDLDGGIQGFQVAYAGLVEGTYAVEHLASAADAIAQRAVELAASFRDLR